VAKREAASFQVSSGPLTSVETDPLTNFNELLYPCRSSFPRRR